MSLPPRANRPVFLLRAPANKVKKHHVEQGKTITRNLRKIVSKAKKGNFETIAALEKTSQAILRDGAVKSV